MHLKEMEFNPKSKVNKSGNVFKGKLKDVGTKIVVKCMKPGTWFDKNLEETFSFLKKATSLAHPNIARVFGLEIRDGSIYFGLKFFDINLEIFVKAPKEKYEKHVKSLGVCENISQGLNYLHKKNIIHNNIHPKNVLVNVKSGVSKLSDYGIQRTFPVKVRKR